MFLIIKSWSELPATTPLVEFLKGCRSQIVGQATTYQEAKKLRNELKQQDLGVDYLNENKQIKFHIRGEVNEQINQDIHKIPVWEQQDLYSN